MLKQRTLKSQIRTTGVGLHTGARVDLPLRPAPANTGIVFHRIDLPDSSAIPADARNVGDTRLSSSLQVDGARVSTVEHLMSALAGLGIRNLHVDVAKPDTSRAQQRFPTGSLDLPRYHPGGDPVATRKAYGEALAAVGVANGEVVALDGEVSNSTFADIFAEAHPQRFFEMYIAEQQLVASAVGLQVRGYIPFASTFAAFFSRAYDFIRMAAISQANIRLAGSHAGCEIGTDGPSQMALEDLASLRAIEGSTVLYPSDATSTAQLVEQMAGRKGIVYLRTTRGAYPVLYDASEKFFFLL